MYDDNSLIYPSVEHTLIEISFTAAYLRRAITNLSSRKGPDSVLFTSELTSYSYSLNSIQGALKYCHGKAKAKGCNYEN